MRRPSATTQAEIAGYIVGKDGKDTSCPWTDGPLRDAWYEGFVQGTARRAALVTS